MPDMGGTRLLAPTAGATVTVTINTEARVQIASWTAAENETVNISGTPIDGQLLILVITNDGVLPRVVTHGTGLASLGTITGTTSKKSTITFIAVSNTFVEIARSLVI